MKRIVFLVTFVVMMNIIAVTTEALEQKQLKTVCNVTSNSYMEQPIEIQSWMLDYSVWY